MRNTCRIFIRKAAGAIWKARCYKSVTWNRILVQKLGARVWTADHRQREDIRGRRGGVGMSGAVRGERLLAIEWTSGLLLLGATDCSSNRPRVKTSMISSSVWWEGALSEYFQDEKKQIVVCHEILRMRIYRIPSRERLMVCGQWIYSVSCKDQRWGLRSWQWIFWFE